MKLLSIVLSEGRKEDLKKKYSDKYKEYPDTLEFILGISDLTDSNHKYTDFVLKNLHPNSSTTEVEDMVELVKDFDKYQSNLNKKDINQYKNIEELSRALEPSKIKGKEKNLSSQVEKIYEDNKFLVVKPKTEEASCKYGSNTRWCVTSAGSGHFKRYTEDFQALYFIINKLNSTNTNYSKVAIHFDNYGNMRYWNSQDSSLSETEKGIFEYAFPEIIEAIKQDYRKNNNFLERVFNIVGEITLKDIIHSKSNFTLEVSVIGFDEGSEEKSAMGNLAISLISKDEPNIKKIIHLYQINIQYDSPKDRYFNINVEFVSDSENMYGDEIELGLDDWRINYTHSIRNTQRETADAIRYSIASRVMNKVKDNPELIKKFFGDKKVWRPNRNYGYTFKENKGLIKKLVEYLDAGNDNSTRMDFLVSIGKLKKKIVDGKTLYAFAGPNEYLPANRFGGHFSSFFASAKLAGIIDYRKKGHKFILTKGPNFEVFKRGELKPI